MPPNSFGRTVPLQNASILRQSINLQYKLERKFNFVLQMPISTRFWQIPIVDSRNIHLRDKVKIIDWDGKFTVTVPQDFLDWKKQYNNSGFVDVET